MKFNFLGGVAAAVLLTAGQVHAVAVPGSSNPFLAGQPDGASCCGGDSAPGDAAVLAATGLIAGQVLSFSATGGTNYNGGTPDATPDGDTSYIFDMTPDAGTGVSGALQVNVDGLVGVFLSDGAPSGVAPASDAEGISAVLYTPGLDQIFWIGDGLTGDGDGTGTVQQFVVPTGATRLFLGTVDGSGWFNNSGSIEATVNGLVSAAPEPSSWSLMILGVGVMGAALRRRVRSGPRTATGVA